VLDAVVLSLPQDMMCIALQPPPAPLSPGHVFVCGLDHVFVCVCIDTQFVYACWSTGAKSPADIKLAFRRELMRWHPDKFTARFGPRLAPADKEVIDAGVHAVAQQLTALKQQ
jgi:hypothetical protein